MRTLLSITLLTLLALCGQNRCAASDVWLTQISSLPEDVRRCLVARFDRTRRLRQQRPEIPEPSDEQIITDDRARFAAGCMASSHQSHVLFVRAKAVLNYWIIQVEIGGFAHRIAAIAFFRAPDGTIHEVDLSSLPPEKRTADAVADFLAAAPNVLCSRQ